MPVRVGGGYNCRIGTLAHVKSRQTDESYYGAVSCRRNVLSSTVQYLTLVLTFFLLTWASALCSKVLTVLCSHEVQQASLTRFLGARARVQFVLYLVLFSDNVDGASEV